MDLKDAREPIDWTGLPFGELIDHIVDTHHAYLVKELPDIKRYLQTIDNVHGGNHPELAKIRRRFTYMMDELLLHLPKEEMDLFPFIRRLDEGASADEVRKCMMMVDALEAEHDGSMRAMLDIRRLTSDYTLPEEACPTYMMAYQKLQELERDLKQHIQLEDSILFPRAVEVLSHGIDGKSGE